MGVPAPWQGPPTNRADSQGKLWLRSMVHESTGDLVHTESGYRLASGSSGLPHNPNIGSHGCPGLLRHLHVGNSKPGPNAASCFPIPPISQPLTSNVGAFDPTGYTVPVGLTGPMYPPVSTQGFQAKRYAFMYEPRQE